MFAFSAHRVRFSVTLDSSKFPTGRRPRRVSSASMRPLSLESLEHRALLAVVPLISETAPSRGIVVTQALYDDLGLDWTGGDVSFDDSSWIASTPGGANGIGAPIGSGKYGPFATINAAAMAVEPKSNTAYLRIPFSVSDLDRIESLTLKMRFDDGFIAFLNGVEIARQNVAAQDYPSWDSRATTSLLDATSTFTTFDVSAHASALHDGTNVLAIRGFDRPIANQPFPIAPDFVIQAALDAEVNDPPPTANDDVATAEIDTPVMIPVLANDVAGADPIDPTTVQVVDAPSHGTVAVNPATGAITYSPNSQFRGTDTFTYRVRDTSSEMGEGNPTSPVTLVSTSAAHRRIVPTSAVEQTWIGSSAFDDTAWLTGTGGVGYDTDAAIDYEPYFTGGVVAMQNVNPSVLVRYPFSVENAAQIAELRLRMRFEDGFAAWINGVQVAASNAPDAPTWNSLATGGARNELLAREQDEFVIDLAAAGVTLNPGANQNILAVQGLNDTIGSSDLLAQPELIADLGSTGRWSNEATVTVSVVGIGPVAVDDAASTIGRDPVTIDVLANDEQAAPPNDFPLRPESVTIVTPPANGTATVNPETGAITYRANIGFSGNDTLRYTVRDAAPIGGETGDNTIVPKGAVWKYLDDGSDQGSDWQQREFDDSTWNSGPAEFGYGDGGEATVVDCGPAPGKECSPGNPSIKFITTYFRREFDLTDASDVNSFAVSLRYDDGGVIYLNGAEIGRANMPQGQITNQTAAIAAIEDTTTTFTLSTEQRGLLRSGRNVIAVEIHQQAATSSDMSFDLQATAAIDGPTGRVSNEATVTIAVASTNTPPIANDDEALTTAGEAVSINVVANDEPQSAPIVVGSVQIVTSPQHGTATVNSNGTVVYAPNPDFLGEDSFTYTVRDAENRISNAATVSVDVASSIVTARNDSYSVDEDDVLNIPASFGVLRNDTTNSGQLVSAALVEAPEHGTLLLTSNGGFQYVPNANFSGEDHFRYRAVNSLGESDEAAVVVQVSSSPDAPFAFGDLFLTTENTPLVVVAAPAQRQLLVAAGANWKYLDDGTLPPSLWRGLSYDDTAWPSGIAQFGFGDGDEATLVNFDSNFNARFITTYFRHAFDVDDVNNVHALRLGLLRDDGARVYLNGQQVALSNLPQDASFLTPALESVSSPQENAFLRFDIDPVRLVTGRNVVAVEVHQSSLTSNDMSFDLYLHGDVAGPVTDGVLLNDGDPDGDYKTALLVSQPTHGTLAFTADGGFTYTPDPGFVGSDSFTYRANDGERQSDVATVVINVVPNSLAADVNEDNIVDLADVAMVVAGFGQAAGADKHGGDVNGDGCVDLRDAIAVHQAMGQKKADPAAAPQAVIAMHRGTNDIERPAAIDRALASVTPRAVRRGANAGQPSGESSRLDAQSVDRSVGRLAESVAQALRVARRRS